MKALFIAAALISAALSAPSFAAAPTAYTGNPHQIAPGNPHNAALLGARAQKNDAIKAAARHSMVNKNDAARAQRAHARAQARAQAKRRAYAHARAAARNQTR